MTYTQLVTPNLIPAVIYNEQVKLTSWAGWCISYAEVVFGTPRLYPSAWAAWQATTKKHTNQDFPKGIYFPVWFSHYGTYGTPPSYGNWGHVAICRVAENGSLTIWSSPASNKTSPDTYTSIAEVERIYSASFVGWSEDLAGVTIINGGQGMDIKAAINGMNQAAYGKPMDAKVLEEKYNYIANGGSWAQLTSDIFANSPWWRSLPRIITDVYVAAGVALDSKKKDSLGYDLGQGRLTISGLVLSLFKPAGGPAPADPKLAAKAEAYDELAAALKKFQP